MLSATYPRAGVVDNRVKGLKHSINEIRGNNGCDKISPICSKHGELDSSSPFELLCTARIVHFSCCPKQKKSFSLFKVRLEVVPYQKHIRELSSIPIRSKKGFIKM